MFDSCPAERKAHDFELYHAVHLLPNPQLLALVQSRKLEMPDTRNLSVRLACVLLLAFFHRENLVLPFNVWLMG